MEKIIYITRNIPEIGLKLLRENNIKYDIGKSNKAPTKKELIKILKSKPYSGVISFLTDEIDSDVFESCPTARIFANFSVGFNNVKIEDAKIKNVYITNTPNTSAIAVAEHTVALIMALTTRIVESDEFIRRGKFKGWDPNLFIGTDLNGKTIGLIGGGQIGTKVAQMLHNGFNVKIIYHDIIPNKELEESFKVERKELNDLIKEADIISLHIPLNDQTKHLINKERLSMMKRTAFLINTARGAIIDEKALVYALKNKIIKGAGLDVFEFEPKITKGLLKLDDVILTPHIASARQSTRDMMSEIAAKNIISVLEGGKPINNVY